MDHVLDLKFIGVMRRLAQLPAGVLGPAIRDQAAMTNDASYEAFVNHWETVVHAAQGGDVAGEDPVLTSLLDLANGHAEVARGLQARLRTLADSEDQPVLREMAAEILSGRIDPAAAFEFSEYAEEIAAGFERFASWYADIPERERGEIEAELSGLLSAAADTRVARTGTTNTPDRP